MLTRLKISGYKNLERIDISFGPFTCLAGGKTGTGKSNVLEAIAFLGRLSCSTFREAATGGCPETGVRNRVESCSARRAGKPPVG